MDSFNCPNCATTLPARAKYCLKCKEPVKCQECGDLLEAGAVACVSCGEDVVRKNSAATATALQVPMNTVDYSESTTKKGSSRKLRASFTNDVGNGIGGTILHLMGSRVPVKNGKPTVIQPVDLQEEITQDAEYQEETQEPQKALPESDDLRYLKEVISIDGDSISLNDSRLKAKNKKDFGIRLTCLYLYLKKKLGIDKVPRIEITTIARQASVEDGHFREWISNEKKLLRQDGDELTLLLPGSDFAKLVLDEMRNPEVIGKFNLGDTKRRSKPKGKKEEGGDDV